MIDRRKVDLPAEVRELREEPANTSLEVDKMVEIHQTLLPGVNATILGFEMVVRHVAPVSAGGDHYGFMADKRDANFLPEPDASWPNIPAGISGNWPVMWSLMASGQPATECSHWWRPG